MKQTIYVDVLVAVNFFINYYLLLACAKYLGIPAKRGRLAAASALGAAFSLVILLPELPPLVSAAEKLAMSACIVLCAFGYDGIKQFLRRTAAFFHINFAFAGLMIALWYFLAPQGLLIRNSVVYFNISPVLLVLLSVVCYGIISLINRLAGREEPKKLFCRTVISCGGISCDCTARVDTGNSLCEPFSGDPVVVVNRKAVERIIPPDAGTNFRLVPFHSVSGSGLLKAFHPDRLTIYCGKEIIQAEKVYIAVSETKLEGCDALLNPDLMQKNTRPNSDAAGRKILPERRGRRK